MDLELLQKLSEEFSLWLDLEEQNNMVEKVLEQIKPAGLSVQGGAEERVGVKSFDELDDFFEKLEVFE
jgi:phosphoribosylanthranilate isomerase